MDEPATTQPSVSPEVQVPTSAPPEPAQPTAPLTYEETPEIPMSTPSPKKSSSFLKTFGVIIAFIALFVIGVWLSGYIRQFFLSNSEGETVGQQLSDLVSPSPTPSATPAGEWKTYEVVSGVTKQAIPGIAFQLPSDILPLICDGAGCASQGTYLPGGTRFTIAPRGAGQSLRDFRGSLITDAIGTAFITKPVMVADRTAIDFSATFSGRTVSGHTFSVMHGVMIEASDTLSLEVNHFTPNGIVADWGNDDLLFEKILTTFTFAPPPTVLPVASTSGH
jgi:hypothetical protein